MHAAKICNRHFEIADILMIGNCDLFLLSLALRIVPALRPVTRSPSNNLWPGEEGRNSQLEQEQIAAFPKRQMCLNEDSRTHRHGGVCPMQITLSGRLAMTHPDTDCSTCPASKD